MSDGILKPCGAADCSGVSDPCSSTPPVVCNCGLELPPINGVDSSPYVDYATAAAIIASAQVASYVGFVQRAAFGSLLTSFTADLTVANQVTLTAVGNPDGAPGCQAEIWVSLTMKAGSTLTVTVSIGSYHLGTVRLYDCSGTLLDTQVGSGALTFSIAAAGEYVIQFVGVSTVPGFMGGSDTFSIIAASDMTMVANPAVALWDDSGTTRRLQACPKLKMPVPVKPLSGTTWDLTAWYAACADAATALGASQNPQTNACIGACKYDPSSTMTGFTATGGTSLSLAATDEVSYTGSPGPAVTFYGCVNVVGGDTLSIAWSLTDDGADGGDNGVNLWVLDAATGEEVNVQSDLGLSGTLTLSVPYSGAFIVVVAIYGRYFDGATPPGSIDATAVITSSGTLSVNPIQTQYDVGLECPARLNCGDSC